jgi:coenzyme F420-0:L-glutamate ligase
MLLIPIQTTVLQNGDSLSQILSDRAEIQEGDIVVVSSKAVAMTEGSMIDLTHFRPSDEAKNWSEKTGRSAEFCEAVLQEMKHMNGMVLNACPGALLTEVTPAGLPSGSILTANAGLDESNVPKGFALGWPKDSAESAKALRRSLESLLPKKEVSTPRIGIIITDSNCHPRRLGVTAFALAVSGFYPLENQAGKKDLFEKELRITTEALADQLADAANFLMGNAAQSTPAVIIRDHGMTLKEWEGWVPGIHKDEDLFRAAV